MSAAKVLRLALLLVLLIGIVVAIPYARLLDASALETWVRSAGVAAPLLFMTIYACAAVLFLPGSVLTVAGGALFGPVLGAVYSLTGATIGATLAFLIARYVASSWVEQKIGGRLKRLKQGVEAEGWRFVAFVRLVPLFPFNLLNYALGLTRIRLLDYVLASYVCMAPGSIAYTYLGYAGREAITGGEEAIRTAFLALALLALVVFLPRLISRLRRKPVLEVPDLRQRLGEEKDILLLDVRSRDEFAGELGHIAGARNIPVEELQARIDEITDYVERPIAIVCRTQRRSESAARLLASKGFADVHVLKGGMTAWQEAGLPVAR